MNYATDRVRKPPKTMTEAEQRLLLKVSGEHKAGFRDHCIFSLALGTALREHEIAALDVGDIRNEEGFIRRRFPLRVFKRSNLDFDLQETILPDALRYKLEKYLRWKRTVENDGRALADEAPLFASREAPRLSTRTLRRTFALWQKRAGFERAFTFHGLRHTALTNLYRATKDIRLVQRVARHASIESTTIYAQASDEDVLQAVRAQPC